MANVYWTGSNGNVYLKTATGVQDLGKDNYNLGAGGFESNTLKQSVQAQRITDPNPGSAGSSTADSTAALLAQIRALTNAQPRQVFAPNLDFASINAQARSQAEANVNPYYTKQLNDFLAAQAAARSQTEAASTTNIAKLEQDLQDKLAGNATTGARTAQDTTLTEADIAQKADTAQTDSGTQFTTDRLQQGRDLAKAGLTGGLGAQQVEGSNIARNTAETRAGVATDQANAAAELSKARTFEDLATSGSLATRAKESGVKQVNVSLSDFITNQGLDLTSEQTKLEANRQADIVQQADQARAGLVQNFVNSIADPAQRQAALQAYGGLL